MKYLLIIATLLTGCASIPHDMEQNKSREYMTIAATLSGRQITDKTPLPTVYVINDFSVFYRLTCRMRYILCGLGVAGAVYVPQDHLILVNNSYVKPDQFDSVLVHEFVHHLQVVQHDKRECYYLELEAYSAQARYLWLWPESSVYDKVRSSCELSRLT